MRPRCSTQTAAAGPDCGRPASGRQPSSDELVATRSDRRSTVATGHASRRRSRAIAERRSRMTIDRSAPSIRMMPSPTSLDPDASAVPEKPALEGLEAKWMPRWEADGVYRFDRSAAARRGLLHRHAAADGQRLAARRPRLLVHAHRRHRAVPADARQGGVLSDGVGRQRPADRAARAELLRRALRSVAAVRRRRSCRRTSRPSTPISVSRPNFIELCERLTGEDEKAFEQLWRHLGLSVDWSMTYATIGRRAQRVSQLAFLRLLQRGIAYQLEAPTLWDVDFRTAVAQAELEDREVPGAYHRIRFARRRRRRRRRDRHDAPRADPGLRRAGRASRRRALPAAVRHATSITPLFGVRVPVRAHPLADPEKGTGIAMICTFGDVTDVTWWRELSLPVRAVIQADGTLRPRARGARRAGSRPTPAAAQAPLRRARGPVRRQGAREDRRAAARVRRSDRRPAADHAPGEVLREGRPAARDRHEPAVVHQDDRVPRGAAGARRASCSGIRRTCRRATRTGSTG